MNAERTRSNLRGTITILVVAAIYEATARSGVFPRALMPTLAKVSGCSESVPVFQDFPTSTNGARWTRSTPVVREV